MSRAFWEHQYLSSLGTIGVAAVAVFGIHKLVSSPRMEPPKRLPKPPAGSKFIVLPESKVKLRYTDTATSSKTSNNEDGVTFVLIHGFAGVLETWKFLIPPLLTTVKNNCRVLSLDLVGSGHSDKPEGFCYSYRQQGAIVVEFLSTLGVSSRVVLVGHSSGTVVAAAAALECPAVIGTVFIANALFRAKSNLFSHPWLKPFFGWLSVRMTANRKRSLARMHHPNHVSVLTDDLVQAFEAPTQLPNFHKALVETIVAKEPPYEELFDALLRTSIPMLLVHGKDDTYKPLPCAQAATIQGKLDEIMEPEIRRSRIETVTLEECAHYAQHEQPEALAVAIRSFVGKYS